MEGSTLLIISPAISCLLNPGLVVLIGTQLKSEVITLFLNGMKFGFVSGSSFQLSPPRASHSLTSTIPPPDQLSNNVHPLASVCTSSEYLEVEDQHYIVVISMECRQDLDEFRFQKHNHKTNLENGTRHRLICVGIHFVFNCRGQFLGKISRRNYFTCLHNHLFAKAVSMEYTRRERDIWATHRQVSLVIPNNHVLLVSMLVSVCVCALKKYQ